jgi:putative PIN family toxin of toxin-antitoxin system
MKVVLDCNVLISARLNTGTCRDVFAAVIDSHRCILSKEILGEYVAVARRKHFAKAATILFDLIRTVSRNAVFVTPDASPLRVPDPKDQIYLDAAIAARADVLITGNKRHFPDAIYQGVKIVSPREFLVSVRGLSEWTGAVGGFWLAELETAVIPCLAPIREGRRRCGRLRTAPAIAAITCAIRAT